MAYKLVVAVAGMSLAINAYLVKDRVEEMTVSIKELNANIGQITVKTAVMETRADAVSLRLANHSDRLVYIERWLSEKTVRSRAN